MTETAYTRNMSANMAEKPRSHLKKQPLHGSSFYKGPASARVQPLQGSITAGGNVGTLLPDLLGV